MPYKTFQLQEILEPQPKSRHKASDGLTSGTYPFFTSSPKQSKWYNEADYTKGSIILGTGGGPSVHYADAFSTSTDVLVFSPRNTNVSAEYVQQYLRAHVGLLERGFKGAGLKHISSEYVKKLSIVLPVNKDGSPDIVEQERIVTILHGAEALKTKRALADQKMAAAIPALFEQMFRDKSWRKEKLINLIPKKGAVRTGPFGSQLHHAEFTSEGIPILGIDNVVSNTFRWASPRHLPKDKYEKFKKYRVYPDDVLVTIMGTVGRVCVAPSDLPECMSTKHLCVITTDPSQLNHTYLWASLLYDRDVKHQTKQVAKGAIMEGWNSTIIKNLIITVPPLQKQNEFAEAVKSLEDLAKKQKKSATQIENLFTSLLSKSLA